MKQIYKKKPIISDYMETIQTITHINQISICCVAITYYQCSNDTWENIKWFKESHRVDEGMKSKNV